MGTKLLWTGLTLYICATLFGYPPPVGQWVLLVGCVLLLLNK